MKKSLDSTDDGQKSEPCRAWEKEATKMLGPEGGSAREGGDPHIQFLGSFRR